MDKDPWYTACPIEGCNKKVTPGRRQSVLRIDLISLV